MIGGICIYGDSLWGLLSHCEGARKDNDIVVEVCIPLDDQCPGEACQNSDHGDHGEPRLEPRALGLSRKPTYDAGVHDSDSTRCDPPRGITLRVRSCRVTPVGHERVVAICLRLTR